MGGQEGWLGGFRLPQTDLLFGAAVPVNELVGWLWGYDRLLRVFYLYAFHRSILLWSGHV